MKFRNYINEKKDDFWVIIKSDKDLEDIINKYPLGNPLAGKDRETGKIQPMKGITTKQFLSRDKNKIKKIHIKDGLVIGYK